MIVDLTWDGVVLSRGAEARREAGGWFVALEQPMPVGTLLALEGEIAAKVRVVRTTEGEAAGMLLEPTAGALSEAGPVLVAATPPVDPAEAPATPPSATAPATTAPSAEAPATATLATDPATTAPLADAPATATPPVSSTAVAKADAAPSEPAKRKRRRSRKTIIGH